MATTVKENELCAKINQSAYDKIIYLRDLKNCEVAMFGQTLPEDPLHVVDIHLVKQTVSYASADIDPNGQFDYVCKMIEKGIPPINSERFWIHTHPMSGSGSATPSSKDMATWNCEENSLRNFMVMMIISKSGEISCKLRVRANISNLNIESLKTLYYEKDIKVNIVEEKDYTETLKDKMLKFFGETAYSVIPLNILKSHYKAQYEDLKAQYDLLVEEEKPVVVNAKQNNSYFGHNYNDNYRQIGYHYRPQQKKRTLSPESIPGVLAVISEHATQLETISADKMQEIGNYYNVDSNSYDEMKYYLQEFNKAPKKTTVSKLMQALIAAPSSIGFDGRLNIKSIRMDEKIDFLNSIGMTFSDAQKVLNKINNEKDNA